MSLIFFVLPSLKLLKSRITKDESLTINSMIFLDRIRYHCEELLESKMKIRQEFFTLNKKYGPKVTSWTK